MFRLDLNKTLLILALLITGAGVSSFYFLSSRKSAKSPDPTQKTDIITDSIPLLIVSSHLSQTENVRFGELSELLRKKRLFCTSDVAEDCQTLFRLNDRPTVLRISEFNHANDSIFLITSLDSLNHQFKLLSVDSVHYFKAPETYPFRIPAAHPFNFKEDITHYVHTGVTAITRSTGSVLDRKGIDFYLQNIKHYFKDPEYIHISNEVSMQDQCDYASMKMKFATRSEHFDIIRQLRANIIELTGNHNLDMGQAPYLNSLKWYKENKMAYFGGGSNPEEAARPLIITLNDGSRIAWIGFNEYCPCGECADNKPGANRYKPEKAKNLIDSLKRKADISYIIACVQFGEVDSYSPTASQRTICKFLLDTGADVVLGSQAHQAQEIALYKKKMIFYGLGNFLFDQIHRIGVRQAFFLNCYFYKGKIVSYQPVYTFMNSQRQPTIASDAEKLEIQKSILKKDNFPTR